MRQTDTFPGLLFSGARRCTSHGNTSDDQGYRDLACHYGGYRSRYARDEVQEEEPLEARTVEDTSVWPPLPGILQFLQGAGRSGPMGAKHGTALQIQGETVLPLHRTVP